MHKKSINLIELLLSLSLRKRLIILMVLFATLIGIGVAMLWPKTYRAELSFIVTDGNSLNFSSGGLLSGLANLSVSGSNVTSDQALVLIRSREIQNTIIEEFDLEEVFGTSIPEALRKKLDTRIEVVETREAGLGFNNIISITMAYSDKDPQRAFELINAYYSELESKVEGLNKKNIEEGFLLIENRLAQNEDELREAEDSLVAFQTRYGILQVEEQARAQISAIAELRTEIVKLEVEIGYLTQVLGESNSKISDLKTQKQQFENKYDELLNGFGQQEGDFEIFRAISEMPELFLEYLRRYRNVVVQEEIYKVLYPQYEQQKLNYEEVSSGLLVIDPALIPTYKDKPKRAYIIIAFFFFGLFFSVFLVLLLEWRSNLKEGNPEDYDRYNKLIQSLTRW
ncbi:MAG: hypothetical protein ED557_11615 [Balneola sp.]|nr:MAG: hypothetical protein ED557_11615 [Balneola sp.]